MSALVKIKIDPQHAWDQALWGFHESTRVITEMAKSSEYRGMAVNDMGEIADAVLAANLMWNQLRRGQ
jgi:hypothetical protein